uniref:DNA primase n=1 Tax=Candidatus Ventrenecus sp. TaxID=3085654 RepID=UPI003FEF9BA2
MPKISQETIDEIRNKADIVDIIKEYIPLIQKGKNYFGVCPFHQDHSPSMSVSKERQLFKCFSCGAGGNVFKFVSDYENISYIEAVSKVGSKVGINLNIEKTSKVNEKYKSLYEIMDLTNLFFENNIQTDNGSEARNYLHQRGLNDNDIKEFNLGLSLNDNNLAKFLEKKKMSLEQALSLGLVNQKNLEYTDVFKNRILFPIHDLEGHVVGFTGRIYKDNNGPKYLNSRETPLFRKGQILFNYHRAKKYIQLQKEVILVEGNMDAIRMYINDFKNTLALMGTSLTEEQVRILKNLRSKVILMLDNDEAGLTATYAVGEELIKSGIEVFVIRLSGKKDPDEYILSFGVEAMKENIERPLSFLEFKLNYLKQDRNLNDASELSLYIKEVLQILKDEDEITTGIILNQISNEYHIPLETLQNSIPKKEEIIIPKEPVKPKKKDGQYLTCIKNILYYMMNDEKYIQIYEDELGYFEETLYREIASEILGYYMTKKKMVFADFLSFIETSLLKDEIYELISSIKDEELTENKLRDYIYGVKQKNLQNKIKSLKEEQKKTVDIYQKELIGKKIIENKIEAENLKKERSVEND